MTTYNGELYVNKQLNSILNQTVLPDEVVIIDDCSTDKTKEIVQQFISENNLTNWRLILSVENCGYINAFYNAIMETKGDIIFLCDHDDIWLPNKIEIMSQLMLNNSQILALSSGFQKIDANDKEIFSRSNPLSSNNNLIRKKIKLGKCVKINPLRVVAYNISPGCTSAFRSSIKDAFCKVHNDKMALVHDWKINIIASALDGLYFVNIPTTLYRLHNNNSLGLTRDLTIESRAKACRNSALEREYMKNIIKKLIEEDYVLDYNKSNKLFSYTEKLQNCILKRQQALNNKSILQSIKLLFEFNLFKNRIYESLLVDVISIIRNKSN